MRGVGSFSAGIGGQFMNHLPVKKSGVWKQYALALSAVGFSLIMIGCGGGGGGGGTNGGGGGGGVPGACGSPAGSNLTVVCGTVEDNGGNLVQGATIQLYDNKNNPVGSPVTTNANGRYVISNPPSSVFMYAVVPPAGTGTTSGYDQNMAAVSNQTYLWQSGAPLASNGTLCMPLLNIIAQTDNDQGIIEVFSKGYPPPAPNNCPR